MKIMKRYIAAGMLSLLLVGMFGCVKEPMTELVEELPRQEVSFQPETSVTQFPAEDSIITVTPTPVPKPEPAQKSDIHFAESYEEISAALKAARAYRESIIAVAEAEPEDAPATEAPASEAVDNTDFSDTNVQVCGIDEADLVKTDGKHIYVLANNEIRIWRAAGADTALVGQYAVNGLAICGYPTAESGEGGVIHEYIPMEPEEMYLFEDKLLVIGSAWVWNYDNSHEYGRTVVRVFDVSDSKNVTMLCDYTQDGWYQDSRLLDGQLVLVSNHHSWVADPAIPESYIPCVNDRLLEPGEIWLPEQCQDETFTIVSLFDALSGELVAANAAMGGTGTVYMTNENLYLGQGSIRFSERSEKDADGAAVYCYEYLQQTQLLRYDLTEGLRLCTATTLDGYLDSQFSLDEYEGHLRLVLTEHRYQQTVTKHAKGYRLSTQEQTENDNSLLVLDMDLKEIGRVDGLGKDERIYSARFDGDYAYFVTFRQTDPLYCVDLSKPANPQVISELKLPGFSDYLQFWSADRLFGLGQDADEDGFTGGLKLAMYDTSEPAALRELHSLIPDDYSSSEALYNHKAILVAADRNLIGFPTGGEYLLYGYDDAEGFTRQGAIDCGWAWNARGLYIGDCFYVCSADRMSVLSLTELSLVCSTYVR